MDDFDGDDDYGAPDGAAHGKAYKKTKLAHDPSLLSNDDEDEEWQGDDDEEWDSSEADPLPHLNSGSDDDDISVPGLSNSEDGATEKAKRKREKSLKSSKERNEQRSKSQPPRTRLKEADTITLNSVPNAPGVKAWWNNLCTIISASSSYPDRAFTWVRKVKRDSDYKVLYDSGGFDSLDIKFAVALKKICPTVLTR